MHDRLLHDTVGHNGYTKRTTLLRVGRLWNVDPEYGLWLKAMLFEFAPDLSQVGIQVLFEHADRHPVEAMRALVCTHFAPRPIQVRLVVDLVDKRVSFMLVFPWACRLGMAKEDVSEESSVPIPRNLVPAVFLLQSSATSPPPGV